jgi:hypothetical protein
MAYRNGSGSTDRTTQSAYATTSDERRRFTASNIRTLQNQGRSATRVAVDLDLPLAEVLEHW